MIYPLIDRILRAESSLKELAGAPPSPKSLRLNIRAVKKKYIFFFCRALCASSCELLIFWQSTENKPAATNLI